MKAWYSQHLGAAGLLPLLGFAAMALFLAACGTMETPVMRAASATPDAPPTTAPSLPSATASPSPVPTDTPIPAPTASPTAPPTATATATELPAMSPIDRMVSLRDTLNGQALFNTFQDAANYACSNCHLPDSEETNIGPGLLNIKDRAASRVPGQSAAEYIYQSIIDPLAYIVEGFDPELMPKNWQEIYTQLEIFDIVAYLLTLEGDPADA